MTPMTTAGSAEKSAATAVDFGALAGRVAAALAGPRSGPPEREVVADALRRRAEGEGYEQIAAELGISAKRAASWCRAASRLDPGFDAREQPRRKVRAGSAPRVGKMLSVRLDADLWGPLEQRATAERRSVSAVVSSALGSYFGRKTPGVETLVRRELRKKVREELRELAAAIGAHGQEVSRQGNNLNQLTIFCNRYKELPVAIVDELAATRLALEANTEALEALHRSVLARFEDGA